MQENEKLGFFSLGKKVELPASSVDRSFFYEAKNFTTHAVCVGMTGSGKTGLGIAILEEAALNKIPALIIDPKGDITNLLLAFPGLSAKEFAPWLDPTEAERKGMDISSYASFVANTWKEGLKVWGEDGKRIEKFKDCAEFNIYTPANNAGIPLSILSSFAAPPQELMKDRAEIQKKIQSITSSLLAMVGIHGDPIKSREHILISTLIEISWQKGEDIDISTLIQHIQKPPITAIGALDIDTFFSAKERLNLSISLNNLLASPGFQAWLQGDPLNIDTLLFTSEGKPKISVIYIAHLSDSERMFFVTLLLNEFLTWMRQQPGTSALRALLYMDEIFGFFPPTASPPSKLPMLTLLKQARAFGIGIILATQNPVDLDYKGLANCGTWFIGKLQTERDKARVLEGLKIASNGNIDAANLDKMLLATGNRTFIMRSIYEKEPLLFETRWTLSYLKGPLTLQQISFLMSKNLEKQNFKKNEIKDLFLNSSQKPVIASDITEYFIKSSALKPCYEARLFAKAKLHFVDTKNKIDVWKDLALSVFPEADGKSINWDSLEEFDTNLLSDTATSEASFSSLPLCLSQEKNYALFSKELAATLYQKQTYSFFQTTTPKMISKENESESEFRQRLSLQAKNSCGESIKKSREKYAEKIAAINNKIAQAEERLAQKKQKTFQQKIQTFIAFATTIFSAFLGKKLTKSTISQTGTTFKRASQISKESNDATQAELEVQNLQQQLQDMQQQMASETQNFSGTSKIEISTTTLKPRKSDIMIEKIALLWWPKI